MKGNWLRDRNGGGGCGDEGVRGEEKRLHGECLSRVHSCRENGVGKAGVEELRRLRMSIAIIP